MNIKDESIYLKENEVIVEGDEYKLTGMSEWKKCISAIGLKVSIREEKNKIYRRG